MRRLLALGVLVALSVSAGCATAPPASAELTAAISAASPSVGRILASRCDAPPASGSAVAISDDLVLTAAHVAENSRTVSVRFPGRLPVLADAIGEEPTRDLMLLRTREPLGLTGLELADSPARTGEMLGVLGYPDAGDGIRTRTGALTAMDFTTSFRGADQQFLRLDAESVGGNSGGAVIDQAGHVQGLVVAVISSLRPSESSRVVTLAVPVADVAGQVSTWRGQAGPATTSVGQACPGEGEQRYGPPELTASGTGQMTAEASQLIWLALTGWNAGQWQAAAQQYTDAGRADLGLVSDAPVVHWLAVEVSGVSGSSEAVAAKVRTRSVVAGHCRDEQWSYQLRYSQGHWLIDSVRTVGQQADC